MRRFIHGAAATVLALGGLVSCDRVDQAEIFSVEEPFGSVVIEIEQGDVQLRPGEELQVERRVQGFAGFIDLHTEVHDGFLHIRAACPVAIGCRVDSEIAVPPGIPVEVRIGTGDLILEDLDNPLDLEVATGSLVGEGLRSPTVLAMVGAGEVDLSFEEAPEVSLVVGAGGVTLEGVDPERAEVVAREVAMLP